MLKVHQQFIDRVHVAITGVLIVTIFCAYYWLLSSLAGTERLKPLADYLGTIIIFASIVMFTMYSRQFSDSARLISPFIILYELCICYVFGALGYSFATYVFKSPHLSRAFLLGGMILSFVTVGGWHLMMYWFYRELRVHSLNFRKILLVGNKYTLPHAIKVIENNHALGLKIFGVMGLEDVHQREFMGYPHHGSVERIQSVLNKEAIDYVIFTIYRQDPQHIEQAMLECRERGIEVWFKPDFMHFETMIARVDYLDDMPLFVFSLGPRYGAAFIAKRILDILASGMLLILFAIPMLIIGIIVSRSTPGPVFFKQSRMGLNGRHFKMYKFRTMYHEADQRKAEYNLKNEMKGPVFKMSDDPRITPTGKTLRRYSLDELPQLWNVFKGDMSLVGPRPPLPSEVELYKGWQRRRLSMRPGITCLWQVTGRNKIDDFEEWAKLDLLYIDEWSLWVDFKILFKTIPAVLKGTGL